MIYVPPIAQPCTPNARRSKRASDQAVSGFADYMHEASAAGEEPAAPQPVSPIAQTNPLLGAQEISDGEMQTKAAIRHAHSSLDMLEDLRMALLCGGIPASMFNQIDALLQEERTQQPDAALQELLDDIELRVAVERAKLEMASQQTP